MKTKNKLCPVGTEVQTVIFDKSNFNESSAKKWAKSNDLKYGYVDEKDKTYRIRQQEPDYFVNGSLRTIDFTKGVKAVIGCPKPKYRKFEYGGEADDMLTGTWTGSFDNNYEGKNPLDVWNNWTQEQKRHFLYDHYQEIIFREKNYYESGKIKEKVIAKEGINEYIKITNYNSLPLVIREAVLDHTIMGQYSSGGQIDVNDGCIQETIRLIDEDKKIHDWFIDSHNKKLVIIFDNELKLNEVDRINSLLKDFYICHDIIDTEVLPVFDSEYRMITLDLKTDKFEIIGSFGAGGVVDEFQPKTQIVLETPPMFSSFRMGASQSDFPAMVNKAGYMFVDVSNHTKTSYNITIQIEESRFKINDKVEGLKYLEKQEYSWFNSTTYMAYYIKTKSLLEIQYHIEKNIEKLMPSIKLDGLILKVYKSNAVNQIISTTPELQLEKATASKSDKPEIPAKTESKPETSETKKSDQPKTENPTDNPSEVESEVRRLVELAKKYEKEGKFGLVLKKKDGSKAVLAYPQQYPSMFPEDEWFVVYSSVKESETSDDAPDYELLNKMLDYVKELFKYQSIKIETDAATVQKIKNSIQEGEMMLRTGTSYGRKLSQEELDSIRVSVNNSRKKIGLQNTEYQKGGGIGNKGIYIIKVNNTYGNYVIEDKHGFSEIRKKYRYQATKYDTLEKAQESLIRLKKQWNDTDYIIVRVTNSFFKKYSNGGGVGEVQNNDKYYIYNILSKTDFDEQTKKSMIEDFVNAGYKNVYSLKTQENLSDEFKIEQTADNIMNGIDWNYSMSDANTIAEIIHSIKDEDKEPEKAKWNLTVTGETPEKDEGFWENYKSVTLSDTQPDSGRYMGYKWVEMSIKDGVPEGYWEKIVTEIPEVKEVPVKDVKEIEYSLQILEYLNKLLGRKLDKSFLIGKRVELKKMKGESQMPEGMTGIIDSIDGIGQFHIKWDNGSSLALIPEEDEFKVFFAGGEILVGGKGDKLTLQQIAKKHNVPLSMIQKQFLLGIKFESEHTSDKKMQQEIVKDHLSEFPNYYTALKGMETYLERMKEGKSDSGLYLDIDKTIDSMYFLVPLSIQGVKYLEVPSEFPDKRRIQFYSDKDFDKAVINYSKSKLKNQVSA